MSNVPAARGADLGQSAGCSLCSFPHTSYKEGWQEAQVLGRAVDLGPIENKLQQDLVQHPAVESHQSRQSV